jgi:hypothetical protein
MKKRGSDRRKFRLARIEEERRQSERRALKRFQLRMVSFKLGKWSANIPWWWFVPTNASPLTGKTYEEFK